MEALQIDAHDPIAQRTQRVREAFQKATPEMKAKIFELAPFPIKSEYSSDINGFCQWSQSWPQWQQSHW